MVRNHFLILLINTIYIFGNDYDCQKGYVKFDESCYYIDHIDVLQSFIDLNNLDLKPHKIGNQQWEDGKLTHLYLHNQKIEKIPDSIGKLKGVEHIDLSDNNIRDINETICDLPHYLINLSNNAICPDVINEIFCIEYLSDQDINSCQNFSCPSYCPEFYTNSIEGNSKIQKTIDGNQIPYNESEYSNTLNSCYTYIEKDGKCYNEIDWNVLESLIDKNSSLKDYSPLQLGNQIGYQNWVNGKLTHLELMSNELTHLPEEICEIYEQLESFDVSNNFICPQSYPSCIAYIGQQNGNCNNEREAYQDTDIVNTIDISNNLTDISVLNTQYFENDILVLQQIIDLNPNILSDQEPLDIGEQVWESLRLVSLDLSGLAISQIPNSICSIINQLKTLKLGNNFICPPYPRCIEYISGQNISECKDFLCPENYEQIDDRCYHKDHLNVLKDFIASNTSLMEIEPPHLTGIENGHVYWENGKIVELILNSNQLQKIPESICTIYSQLSEFDISNNLICPHYPECITNIGYQKTDLCESNVACQENYIEFDNECYSRKDLNVLVDFTKENESLHKYHPLMFGYQEWNNGRLHKLYINELKIGKIPESIYNLDTLKYLNISNNEIESLPKALCDIYPNLIELNFSNNFICSSVDLHCFEFIEEQDCKYGTDYFALFDEKYYYKPDLDILQEIIDTNIIFFGRHPLTLGMQKWTKVNSKWKDKVFLRLDSFSLIDNNLEIIPSSICDIIDNLSFVNIHNATDCIYYPECLDESIGDFQEKCP
tara:strand:+ start:276 stop:2594 length:2319 start_codon:yes stop_codon:yes gene_type:complete